MYVIYCGNLLQFIEMSVNDIGISRITCNFRDNVIELTNNKYTEYATR